MPTQFFRIDGADQETGEETYLVLRAKTRPQAEKLAREQGLLIASIREANPEDWGAPSEEPAPDSEPPVQQEATHEEEPEMHATSHPHVEAHHEAPPEEFVDPAPAAPSYTHYADESAPARARNSTAGSIVLACAGAALVIGGVLALVLALWPDTATLRNELQQVDFRLHALIQTILGTMLVLSGLIVCLIAALCYLMPRRADW